MTLQDKRQLSIQAAKIRALTGTRPSLSSNPALRGVLGLSSSEEHTSLTCRRVPAMGGVHSNKSN